MSLVLAAALLAAALLVLPASRRRQVLVRRRALWQAQPIVAGIGCVATVSWLLSPAAAVAAALLIGALALRRRRSRQARRRSAEGQGLAAALEILVGELSVGAHPARALAIAAAESGGGVGEVLRSVGARAELGGDVVGGLRLAARGSSVPVYWYRLASYWELASRHGLAISTLIRAAHRDIVERQRYTARVESGLAGARATAAILAGLPILGILLGQLIGAEPLAFLIGSGIGGWLLVIGTGLTCVGLAWADRITDRLSR